MTYSEQFEENIRYSEISEKRVVERIKSFGALAELESRKYFSKTFNEILSRCENNTAILERGKPDILMLTLISNEEVAIYVECKTRLPKYYKSGKIRPLKKML